MVLQIIICCLYIYTYYLHIHIFTLVTENYKSLGVMLQYLRVQQRLQDGSVKTFETKFTCGPRIIYEYATLTKPAPSGTCLHCMST